MEKRFKRILDEVLSYEFEKEWFEFKSNMRSSHEIGEYISALSNSAASIGRKEAYLIWGVSDEWDSEKKRHLVKGTLFDPDSNAEHHEPLKHYLERLLKPSIKLEWLIGEYESSRVVLLIIAAAKNLPTSFDGKRYIRIGSSKEDISRFPEHEIQLFYVLHEGIPTITGKVSTYQNLTFSKLFGYYGSKGILLKEETFRKNLGLLTEDGKYNILAQLLSDDSHLPLRVSIFGGKDKSSRLLSVREFGYNCLLYTLDELLRYGDVLNILQADERDRTVARKDVPLFDSRAFNEAMINAVLHNKWVDGNEPMISVFSDRMEIMSRGTLPPAQTMEGFMRGESVPVNEKLSEIFLQLHISEKSGRGVPTIVSVYGEKSFAFNENSIVVTIPFNWIYGHHGFLNGRTDYEPATLESYATGPSAQNLKSEKIIRAMRENPFVTISALASMLGISTVAVDKRIAKLKEMKRIERVGSRKTGLWKVI